MKKNHLVSLAVIILVDTSIISTAVNYFNDITIWISVSLLIVLNIISFIVLYKYFNRRTHTPILHDRFPMAMSHIRYENRKTKKNQIELDLFSVRNRLINSNAKKLDCDVFFNFKGRSLTNLSTFKFSIFSTEFLDFESLEMKAYHKKSPNKKLKIELQTLSNDAALKEIVLHFDKTIFTGSSFDFTIEWKWSGAFKPSVGYIGLPNYFARNTKKIILELDLSQFPLKLYTVNSYNYKATFNDLVDISSSLKIDNHIYQIQETEPVDDSDYLLYYEERTN